jgi:hypothetical protein
LAAKRHSGNIGNGLQPGIGQPPADLFNDRGTVALHKEDAEIAAK